MSLYRKLGSATRCQVDWEESTVIGVSQNASSEAQRPSPMAT